MHRIIFIGDTKYQKSVARVFGVGEAQDIVNKFRFAIMVFEFEIPIRAFGFSTDKGRNSRK